MMEKKTSRVERAAHSLKCPICGGENFWHREAQLNRLLKKSDFSETGNSKLTD